MSTRVCFFSMAARTTGRLFDSITNDRTVICEFAHLTREIPADILWLKTNESEDFEYEADSSAYGGLDHTGAGRGAS